MTRIIPMPLLLALCLPTMAQPAAPPTTAAEMIDQAERETARMRDPGQQTIALADIAVAWQKLGDARWEKTWAAALAEADKITEPLAAPLTLRGLAVRLWPTQKDQAKALFDKALTLAKALPYVAQKALALREIGHALVGLDDALARQTIDEAAVAARTITTPIFRAAALRDIADAMADLDRDAADKLFAEAAGTLPPADPDETVQLARIEVAAAWCRLNVQSALAAADVIGDAQLREVCYRRMCEALAPVNPDEAMRVVAKIRDEVERPLALVALAAALAQSQPETAAGMARTVLAGASKMQPADRQRVQTEAAVAIAPQSMAEALALLQKVEDDKAVGEALRRIIVRLAQTQPEEALRVLQNVQDWEAREATVMDIMPRIAAYDADRARGLIADLVSHTERVRAWLTLAAAVSNKGEHKP